MSKIVIIGAGAKGSAFALPCIDNNHDVNIVGTHLENDFIDNFKETIHPSQLDLKKEINKIGKFSLTINLHSDLVAELHVLVEKKDSK